MSWTIAGLNRSAANGRNRSLGFDDASAPVTLHGTANARPGRNEAPVTATPVTLMTSTEPLSEHYDCAMLDLDGVVYRGADAVQGAPALLEKARAAGLTLAFVTNNAARKPEAVARQLRDLGVNAEASDVVTSAQAAARAVSGVVPARSPVLVVGGEGLSAALRERALDPVSTLADRPVAVVQGFHPDVGWRQLAQAAYAVAAGLPWVASNLDLTIPTADGIAPGNGTLVAAVAAAVGHGPDVVAGKPYRPLFDETLLRIGASRPLVVGDRLDTDIEGANRCGADSLLVMTGVTDVPALCRATGSSRPSYVAWTLDGLLSDHRLPEQDAGSWVLDGWSMRLVGDRLQVDSSGEGREAGLRAVTSAAWHWYDERGAGKSSSDDDLDLTAALDALRLP